jgi:hypothetical protein
VSLNTPEQPRRRGRRPSAAILACGVVLAGTFGCSGRSRDAEEKRYMPTTAEARRALETVLNAWRDAPDPLPATFDTAGVKFVDRQRRPNQRLTRYEILGETGEEHARQIAVRMTLDPSDGDGEPSQLIRYNVFGKDPVWVFRLEDYEMISHWEHDMSESPRKATGQAGSDSEARSRQAKAATRE